MIVKAMQKRVKNCIGFCIFFVCFRLKAVNILQISALSDNSEYYAKNLIFCGKSLKFHTVFDCNRGKKRIEFRIVFLQKTVIFLSDYNQWGILSL